MQNIVILQSKLMLGLFILFISSLYPNIAFAKSRKATFDLTSNVAGVEVSVIEGFREKSKVIESCFVPCSLFLKKSKIDQFEFSHPDYPSVRVLYNTIKKNIRDGKGPIGVNGYFIFSHAQLEKKADDFYQEKYASDYSKALLTKDQDFKVIKYKTPSLPRKAKRSGWCSVQYDITKRGGTRNVKILDCSEDIFSANTLKAVTEWRYIPKVENGNFVEVLNYEYIIQYQYRDKNGDVIPANKPRPL